MTPDITHVFVRWAGVEGASGYEIVKDGKVVATTGPLARTSKVSVDDQTQVQILDLPKRALAQVLDFSQQDGV